ncbi:hypothetical protein L2E82_51328 [Cichorium intybus]|nr:hypothetical protein L2E82_51328 [Cichorium intybus]
MIKPNNNNGIPYNEEVPYNDKTKLDSGVDFQPVVDADDKNILGANLESLSISPRFHGNSNTTSIDLITKLLREGLGNFVFTLLHGK